MYKLFPLLSSTSLPWYGSYWSVLLIAFLATGFLYFAYLWQGLRSRQKQLAQKKEEAFRNEKAANEEQEILRKRLQILEDGLEQVKKQLRSKTIALVKKTKESDEKGRLLQTLKEEVDELTKQHASTKFQWREVSRLLGEYEAAEDNNFSVLIEELHQNFLAGLNERFPKLTTYDQRLCVYLKSGLTTREIAELLNVLLKGIENL